MSSEAQLFTVAEVATKLRVGHNTVLRWIKDKRVTAIKPGGNRAGYRIRNTDLEKFLHDQIQ